MAKNKMSEEQDDAKIIKVMEQIVKLLNKHSLSIPQLLVLYGNLGYHIGASMAGCTSPGPTIEELKKSYYSNPTVDVGLMLQGLIITDWEKDFLAKKQLSNISKNNK